MIATDTRRRTAEDYRNLPADDWRYQLIDGEIVMAPAPNFFHQTISFNIVGVLTPHVKERDLGVLRYAPLDLYLDDSNVFQPDILFVAKSRHDVIRRDGLHGAPDLVVEILSPHTARYDLNPKRVAYARSGVRELWLVYPEAKKVEIFHLAENVETAVFACSLGETFQSSLFPGLVISTVDIFKE